MGRDRQGPRTLPDGTTKSPLSGLGVGFGFNYNNHMWRQEIFDSRLYVGTFNEATELRFDNPTFLNGKEGFNLWYTDDGVNFTLVDNQGFEDKFNDGVRSLISTPYGLFLGTANQYFGLEIGTRYRPATWSLLSSAKGAARTAERIRNWLAPRSVLRVFLLYSAKSGVRTPPNGTRRTGPCRAPFCANSVKSAKGAARTAYRSPRVRAVLRFARVQ